MAAKDKSRTDTLVRDKPIIGITMGDPAGIGPEIAVKALVNDEVLSICRPLLIGDAGVIREALKQAKIDGVEINSIADPKDAMFNRGFIDVLDLKNVDLTKIKPGQISTHAGKAAVEYIKKAVDLALAKKIQAITTGPINKKAINQAGFKFRGHTEMLVKWTHTKDYAMMFISEPFWVILATTHRPLKDVPRYMSKKRILRTIKLAHQAVLGYRKKKPKIGVAGLNPHAGESGLFGKEEIKHIKPAVEEAKKLGINAVGPISPDAIFNLANARVFDIVVAMYHDQGLIPLKLLAFNKSVNVTVGLPIIRTSVDHGTGFDIAGKGWANPRSLIEAIKVAANFAK